MVLLLTMNKLNFFSDEVIISWLPIIISGYCVAGTSLIFQSLFIKKYLSFFIELWCRKIITGAFIYGPTSSDMNIEESIVIDSKNIQLEERYLQFIYEIQKKIK